jgi:type II secretory pathway pseudopilin PulG
LLYTTVPGASAIIFIMQIKPARFFHCAAFSLVEVMISVVIMGLVFGTILFGYTHASKRVEWSGMSLAAQAMALRQVEQFYAAKWDTQANPQVDQTTNVSTNAVLILDLPIYGTNVVRATNTASVTNLQISTNPVANIKMITVNTTWSFNGSLFRNTIVAYRAPDQ